MHDGSLRNLAVAKRDRGDEQGSSPKFEGFGTSNHERRTSEHARRALESAGGLFQYPAKMSPS
jgi:hypothetical protein